jgi:hypothetical protein
MAKTYIPDTQYRKDMMMTMTADGTNPKAITTSAQDDEPWAIWAALMVFLNVFVIAGMTYGLQGIVTVMVGAAFAMVLVLVKIVTEGI